MKSLLVPINFTDNAAGAARYATDLALAVEADVHLLHVMDLGFDFEETEEKGRDLLNSMRAELLERSHGQVAVSTSLRVGDVETQIEEWCRRMNPFAVIMGADDADFHGGYAEDHVTKAVAHLRNPVLVIPSGASFHAVRKIVLACEPDDVASELPVSLGFLKQLRSYFACSFDIVSISGKSQKDLPGSLKLDLEDSFPELHFIRSSNIEAGIRNYLKNNEADWLMVFPKKHRLLEFHSSRSQRIVTNCPIPVLSVRA
jgi:nucleotide-binding universal stress UspA family protein